MTIIAFAYVAAFAMSATMLIGERGFAYDLRSRRGRRSVIHGGRRAMDPAGANSLG